MIEGQPVDPGLGETVQLLKEHLGQFVAESKATFALVMELFRQQVADMLEQTAGVFGVNHIGLDYFATQLSATSSAIELESRVAECVQAYRDSLEAGLFRAMEQKAASAENYEVAFLERIHTSLGDLRDGLASGARSTCAEFVSSKGWYSQFT